MQVRRQRDELDLGSAPTGEACAQVGSDGYHWRAWHECRALVNQLRRAFGPEPAGTRLSVRRSPHDFGTYLSVACSWPSGDEAGRAYGHRLEAEMPAEWDEAAKAELRSLDPAAETLTVADKPKRRPRGKRGKAKGARSRKAGKAKGGQQT